VRHVVVPAHVLEQAAAIEERHGGVRPGRDGVDPARREQGRVGRAEVRPSGGAEQALGPAVGGGGGGGELAGAEGGEAAADRGGGGHDHGLIVP
jgi:hypothetical protein